MNKLLDAALEYAEFGWHVLPLFGIKAGLCECGKKDCHSPGKHPWTHGGLHKATRDAGIIRGWWDARPNSNIGVLTGAPSGIIVMDVDDLEKRPADIPDTISQVTGSGGEHYFFLHPGVAVKTKAPVIPGVDSRAEGGYIVAPPSMHHSGFRYEWKNPPGDLPLAPAPQWWVEACNAQGSTETGPSIVGEEILSGGRNNALTSAGGAMRRAGLGYDAILAALKAHNLEKCRPPLDDFEVTQIAKSVSRYKDQAAEDRALIAAGAEMAEIILKSHHEKMAAALVNRTSKELGPPPEFMPPEGNLIQEIAQYILDNSERPLPALAAISAACFVGALGGRKYESPSKLGPNLIAIGLAESSAGKDKSRKMIKSLAAEAGPEILKKIGADELASAQGLVAALKIVPSQLFLLDEFGLMLQGVTSAGAGGYKKEIAGTMMKLFSNYGTTYNGSANADVKLKPRQIIHSPCMVIYGTSTHETFYRALNSGTGVDGFLARLLCVSEGKARPAQRRPKYRGPGVILLEKIRALSNHAPLGGNLAAFDAGDQMPFCYTVPMPQEIDQAAFDLDESMTDLMSESDAAGAIYGRVKENAIKLALIYAIGEDFKDPIIDYKAWVWGRDIALYCANWMMQALNEHIADNEQERLTKRALKILKEAGPKGISRREFLRKFHGMKAWERDDLIKGLLDSGEAGLLENGDIFLIR